MRPFAFVPLALSASLAASPALRAQTGDQAGLTVTITAGAVTGHHLWTVGKQPLSVLDSASAYDTVRLSRAISSSIVIGAGGTFFPSPHLGLHFEMSYLGLPIDNSCTVVGAYASDFENKNEETCDDINSQAVGGGAFTVFGGVTLRAAGRRTISPYVRGSVGLLVPSRSMIETAGAFEEGGVISVRQVIADPDPRRVSVLLGAAAGFTSPIGVGYQLRLEARDAMVRLARLTGVGSAAGPSPTESRYYHHWALTIGLDVVLERKRGRRY